MEELDIVVDKVYTCYYKKGTKIKHRLDGPAAEYFSGTKVWYLNGVYHREDGPAVEMYNGNKFWYIDGKLHRLDGPAIMYPKGYKEWWVNGIRLSLEKEFIMNIWWGNGRI